MKKTSAFAMTLALALTSAAWAQRPGEQARPGDQQRGERGAPPQREVRPAEPQRAEPQRVEVQRGPEQPHQPPRANRGQIPQPPPQRTQRVKPEPERRGNHTNNIPHVANDHWYGHDKPNDKRYRLDHPWEHGRFEHFGPTYRYNIVRIDPDLHRFWLPEGYWFEVPAWDWPLAADWCWSCGGADFVIYEDPDHPGWYLLYNLHTGAFVHALFMGM
jgi:hypothetical protein